MSLMLRLLTILLLSSIFLNAKNLTDTEDKIIRFVTKAIKTGNGYRFKKVSIIGSEVIPSMKDWKAYFLKIDLILPGKNNKEISVKDIMFANKFVIAKELIDIGNGRSLKSFFALPAGDELYDEKHFLTGNKNAKNRLIIFSDPLCPFCMEFVPDVINFVEKHKNDLALYYYNFPLVIHPGSKSLVKAILAAKKLGTVKDLEKKVYEEAFDFEKSDEKSVLDAFNKVFKVNLTLKDINSPDILAELEYDLKVARDLMINGTPAIYVNGKKDSTRELYKKLVK